MNTEKLQKIDELLTQIAEDAIALASDIAKLKAKRDQIELQLQEQSPKEEHIKWIPKLHDFCIFTDGSYTELTQYDREFVLDTNSAYMTRATPELAEHDAIALHNYARLLAYRAEHWPEFIELVRTSNRIKVCYLVYPSDSAKAEVRNMCDSNRYPDTVYFPAEAEKQLQQALDNGLLTPHK